MWVKRCNEKLWVRTFSLIDGLSWLSWLISGKQAENLSVGKTKSYRTNNNQSTSFMQNFVSHFITIACFKLNNPRVVVCNALRFPSKGLPNFYWPVILEFDSSQKYLLPGDVQCLKNAFTILNDNKNHHSNRNEKLTLYLA